MGFRRALLPAAEREQLSGEVVCAPDRVENRLDVRLSLRRKLIAKDRDPVAACLAVLDEHPADLIVLATSQHQGRMRWLGREVSGPLTRAAGIPALLVPQQAKGFVEERTGELSLRKVLFPVAAQPRPTAALEASATLLELLGFQGTTTFLHVGDRATMPSVEPPAAATSMSAMPRS